MKKIDLYAFIYNDEDFLPFFLDYYRFVDRITLIDSGSNDKSHKIIRTFATANFPEIRIAQTGLDIWDHDKLHDIKNNIWKGSKHDLVMFPDCDEIFYHPDIISFLNRKNANDIYEMKGFEMVAPRLPVVGTSILSLRRGVPFQIYNKSTIWNPKIEIEFLNAHIRYSQCTNVNFGDIQLLHYRNMGLAMMKKRAKRESDRLPQGCKYRSPMTDHQIEVRLKDLSSKAVNVI